MMYLLTNRRTLIAPCEQKLIYQEQKRFPFTKVPIPESLRSGKLTLFQSFLQHRQRYMNTSHPFWASISAEEDPSIYLGDESLDVGAVAQLRVLPRCFNSRQRVLELMSVTMHLGGDLIRICKVHIILRNFQEGYGFA